MHSLTLDIVCELILQPRPSFVQEPLTSGTAFIQGLIGAMYNGLYIQAGYVSIPEKKESVLCLFEQYESARRKKDYQKERIKFGMFWTLSFSYEQVKTKMNHPPGLFLYHWQAYYGCVYISIPEGEYS